MQQAIGGHYCIENEFDAIVIHVNAIGMAYRTDFVPRCNRQKLLHRTIFVALALIFDAICRWYCIGFKYRCKQKLLLHRIDSAIATIQACFNAIHGHYCIESFMLQEAQTYCQTTSASRTQGSTRQVSKWNIFFVTNNSQHRSMFVANS